MTIPPRTPPRSTRRVIATSFRCQERTAECAPGSRAVSVGDVARLIAMCGVAGVVGQGAADRLPSMLAAVAHRGPDGEATFTRGDLALGHRRLAILDLSPAG